MDSPKVWLVEANQRGRAILDRMQAAIRERKAKSYKPNDSNFSGKFNNPTKIITEAEVIQKVRAEAKTARAKVPSDMRAEPYSYEGSKTAAPESRFSKGFKTAGQIAPEGNKPKMSSAFNCASKAKYNADGPERPSPKAKI